MYARAGLVSLLTFYSSVAFADHPAMPDSTRVGVGMAVELGGSQSLFDLYYSYYYGTSSSLPNSAVRVPIILASGLRIEPELSLSRMADDDNALTTLDISGLVAPSWKLGKKGSGYGGGRLGAARSSYSGVGDSESLVDISLGGVLGSEVWLTDYFTFGAEVSITYTAYDEESSLSSAINTQGGFVCRFYLN